MKEKILNELAEILYAIVHALKVFVVYIFPSFLLAVLLYPDIWTLVQENPELAAWAVINVLGASIANYIKSKNEGSEAVQKLL